MDPKLNTLYQVFKKEEFTIHDINLSLPQKYKLLKILVEKKIVIREHGKYKLTDKAKQIKPIISYLMYIFKEG